MVKRFQLKVHCSYVKIIFQHVFLLFLHSGSLLMVCFCIFSCPLEEKTKTNKKDNNKITKKKQIKDKHKVT